MDSFSTNAKEDGPMELPPGFRFHPTDEELITHYLSEKVLNSNFDAIAIGEADLNRIEPWDLSSVAKLGEKEWYFFVVRDRKYPTGQRTNRATEKGYWKATGKDREIYRAKTLVGMKKTLVFYTGRAPRGEKTNWVMHEFRLEGKCSKPKNAKNDWVISRVFKKNSSAKKLDYSQFVRIDELQPRFLPPLMDSSPCNNSCETKTVTANPGHVTCFSNSSCVMEEENHLVKATTKEEEMFMLSSPNNTVSTTPFVSFTNMISEPDIPDYQFVDSISTQCDSVMMKLLYEDANNYLWNY